MQRKIKDQESDRKINPKNQSKKSIQKNNPKKQSAKSIRELKPRSQNRTGKSQQKSKSKPAARGFLRKDTGNGLKANAASSKHDNRQPGAAPSTVRTENASVRYREKANARVRVAA
ncbi:MAG TPA: hypothetical protein V6D17_03970 [Candidatus Obscuribacterales bacterium]